jgi:tetraacyldisaccharide 4'-kinase
MGIVLWPMGKLFEAGARTRAWLYRSGRLARRRLARPVVSIGNLSAGGTGKTPFTIWLFQELRARGVRPAVLTRGYRRPAGGRTLILRDAGEAAPTAGDEAQVMLRQGVAPIGVDADRFRAGRILELESTVDLFLLDDGFQHLALARDLDIVLVDSSRPPWRDRMLPAGLLREPLGAVARAQVIVLTRVQRWMDLEYAYARLKLASPRSRIFMASTRLVLSPELQATPSNTQREEASSAALMFAFAGVGNPKAFFADLCLAGLKVIGTRRFGDHHVYSVKDLRDLERRAREAGAGELITTEKDAVKIPPAMRAGITMPIHVAGMQMEVESGAELIARIESLIH